MKVKSDVRAGGRSLNHNQTAAGVHARGEAKEGGGGLRHGRAARGLRVKSDVKAGLYIPPPGPGFPQDN